MWEYYKKVGTLPPRQLPSSSFRERHMIDWEISYAPTAMTKQAVYNAMRKGSIPAHSYADNICISLRQLMESYWGVKYPSNPKLLTFLEAINDIDLSTSPGFPAYFDHTQKSQMIKLRENANPTVEAARIAREMEKL